MTLKAQVLFVAAHGPAFSGKDSVCKVLDQLCGKDTYRLTGRFAEPIYEMVLSLVPQANSHMSKEEKESPRPELGGLSVRQAMVAIGEGFRQFDKECWIKLWRHSLLTEVAQAITDGYYKVVVLVPDLRKQDELQAFHGLPGDLAILLTKTLEAQAVTRPGRIWPLLQADSVVFQIYGQNAPENAQVNEATETRLPEGAEDIPIINDHHLGKDNLFEHVRGSLRQNREGRLGELIDGLFHLSLKRER